MTVKIYSDFCWPLKNVNTSNAHMYIILILYIVLLMLILLFFCHWRITCSGKKSYFTLFYIITLSNFKESPNINYLCLTFTVNISLVFIRI